MDKVWLLLRGPDLEMSAVTDEPLVVSPERRRGFLITQGTDASC